ncbi:TIGR03087 family PEP-CTERM/XrtA system glycosyltransferase [Salinisphaera sp. Q1T1-3]|uniref:TIGR03087 family PEP-CTERM/XrtA system glycosyltransferase n=1 Tax=Salinisphaera sp. Q1T1-3 TaxID=2321229 RepID=UPI000E75879A|nr:TIGR03087 family PEP-CTERM/XrtA system glycosyltransferase [Salinisphaera sp. Q1T1-3]RJS94721.1 TIGR03087 family PEP-CTERM/XrtA system glycosyltransferase [Salinisphaera sp. Q1T1-3]
MAELLFLSHRIPYPPNKGDKIRSYHWLRELAAHHTVHLGTFIDEAADWAHRDTLDALCQTTCYRALPRRRARLRSLRGLAAGQPLGFAYYHDRAFARYVANVLETRPIDAVLVFSSTVAPYVESCVDVRRVLDFVDVDSDKWAQYARNGARGPMRWVYAREARTLARAERALAAAFDASVFVSPAEAAFFARGAPSIATSVHAIGNGVDTDYFDAVRFAGPAVEGPAQVVFTGAMDYGANVDAVRWFVENVWPTVRGHLPEATFTIVGARPTPEVSALARTPGVIVTGTVDDVRPYLAAAHVAVAPMRIARGIQNKVLEALAMARPVVLTPQAAAGLDELAPDFATEAESAEAFARAVCDRVRAGASCAGVPAARDYVSRHYAWPAKRAALEALLLPAESTVR